MLDIYFETFYFFVCSSKSIGASQKPSPKYAMAVESKFPELAYRMGHDLLLSPTFSSIIYNTNDLIGREFESRNK